MRFTTVIASALCLAEIAVAQPHGRRHYHLSSVNKRGALAVAQPNAAAEPGPTIVTVTVTQYVQETRVPGRRDSPAEAPTPAPVVRKAVNVNVNNNVNVNSNINVKNDGESRSRLSSSSFPSSDTVEDATHVVEVASRGMAPENISGKGGIVWTPYNNDHSCKSEEQFRSELGGLGSKGYGLVRIYGVDCNQVSRLLKYFPRKVFLGVYDVNNMGNELNSIISQVGNNWSRVHTVSIGNELVNQGKATPAAMNQKTNEARSKLRSAGYAGPVVTVDTLIAVKNNPALCQASDYVAVNCHPFFDKTISAAKAGSFLTAQIAEVKSICGNKPVLITETGWPKQGTANGAAVPTTENHVTAIRAIRSALGAQSILLTAKDEGWKADGAWSFWAEKHWGVVEL